MKKRGRKFKMKPARAEKPKPGALPRREAATAKRQALRREAGRGAKQRVVAGTAAARALGIQ